MSIEILSPGIHTTVQDLGRRGYQSIGISPSGVMDVFAHKIANMLVGNDDHCATLEMTLTGAKIKFHHDCSIAITGADLSASIDGVAIENWRHIRVDSGSVLKFSKRKSGCRAYLALAGGINVKKWLGSFSTYLQVGNGGFQGRKLEKNDVLQIGQAKIRTTTENVNWKVSPFMYEFYNNIKIRVLEGKQFDQFTTESIKTFFNTTYTVNINANRVGYRLDGKPLARINMESVISEGVSNGTVQVPSDGKPIILMSDRQTIGGYPKVAQVITVDLAKLAQCAPGDKITFQLVSLEEAQQEYIMFEKQLKLLGAAMKLKGEGK
jgi:antagonist of KipI